MTRWFLFLPMTLCLACGGGDGASDAAMGDSATPTTDGGADSGEMMDGAVDTGTMAMDSGVDAAPDPCTTEGEMRAVSCGNCGLAQQVCTSGVWVEGDCLAQGECAPGSVDEETLPDCTMRARICDAMCSYSAWEVRTPGGECDAGATRTVSGSCTGDEVQPQVCNASCMWEDSGACTGECGTLRTSPSDAAEVCVPAGAFIRGDPTISDAPPHEVTLSAYAIDVYPVTVRRFRECIAAGACTTPVDGPSDPVSVPDLTAPSIQDHAMLWVHRSNAEAFCLWDGGRRLPTEAEWEKAARGPAPRTNPWPWVGGSFRCDLALAFPPCMYPSSPPPGPSVAVTQWPGSRSYYGTYQVALAVEWVSDRYSADYYTEPSSWSNPTGPTAGADFALKGAIWGDPEEFQRISVRDRSADEYIEDIGFRCARDGMVTP